MPKQSTAIKLKKLNFMNRDRKVEPMTKNDKYIEETIERTRNENIYRITRGSLRPQYLILRLRRRELDPEVRDEVRGRAKRVTAKQKANYLNGRLGLIIDGTGKDYDKIATQATELKQLGYDVHMIFVNTSLDTALERNAKRDRKVPESLVIKSWNDVQKNIGKFSQYFRRNFIVVDNNDSEEDIMGPVFKQVRSLAMAKVQNPTGLKWIANELAMKRR